MEIELNINDKIEIYRSDIVTGYMFRRALILKEKQESTGLTGELVTELAQFVVEVFNKQFSLSDLLNGINANELVQTFNNVLLKVLNASIKYQKK